MRATGPPPSPQTSACIWFKVSDTGIGMSEEQLARVVLPFQQADASTTRKFGGSGLGLAICSELIALLNGEFAYASTLGVGSVFAVAIPCGLVNVATTSAGSATGTPAVPGAEVASRNGAPPSSWSPIMRLPTPTAMATGHWPDDSTSSRPRTPANAADASGPGAGAPTESYVAVDPMRRTRAGATASATTQGVGADTTPAAGSSRAPGRPVVLVADDNALNIRVIQRQLDRCGYDAIVATNGQECVDIVKAFRGRGVKYAPGGSSSAPAPGRLDLILMDLNMPVLDGMSAARTIREFEAQLSVATGRSISPLPIFAVTADNPEVIGLACRQAGMNGFLQKPVMMADLAAALSDCTGLTSPRLPAGTE